VPVDADEEPRRAPAKLRGTPPGIRHRHGRHPLRANRQSTVDSCRAHRELDATRTSDRRHPPRSPSIVHCRLAIGLHPICTSAGCSTSSSAPWGGAASFNSFTRQPGWLICPVKGGSPVTLPTTRTADGSKPFGTVVLSPSLPVSTGSITACCLSAFCAFL